MNKCPKCGSRPGQECKVPKDCWYSDLLNVIRGALIERDLNRELKEVPDTGKDLDDFIIEDESFWKDKPLGRTLSLRNRMGKTLAGIGLGALATFTGIDLTYLIEPTITYTGIMEDLSLIQILITVIAMAVTFALGYFNVSPNIKAKLDVIVEYVADELVKATDAKSEEGKKITRSEIVDIVKGVFNKVFK